MRCLAAQFGGTTGLTITANTQGVNLGLSNLIAGAALPIQDSADTVSCQLLSRTRYPCQPAGGWTPAGTPPP